MANRRDGDHHNNDGGDDVNNPVLTRAEFLDFHDENQQFCDSTQQTLDQIQEAFATLIIETLITMTKRDMIIERVALPIVVQTRTGSKTTMKKIVKTRSI